MRRATPLLAAVLLAAACFTSRRPDQVPAATGPRGAETSVNLRDRGRAHGELLSIDARELVLLSDGRIVVVPLERISTAKIEGPGWAILRANRNERLEVREDVARWARFPQGIPPAVLAELLRGAGQAAPDTAHIK